MDSRTRGTSNNQLTPFVYDLPQRISTMLLQCKSAASKTTKIKTKSFMVRSKIPTGTRRANAIPLSTDLCHISNQRVGSTLLVSQPMVTSNRRRTQSYVSNRHQYGIRYDHAPSPPSLQHSRTLALKPRHLWTTYPYTMP